MFLGLKLVLLCVNYLLLVNYLELELWRMVPVNRQSLKYPISVTFTFSFLFFPKEKESHGRDSDSLQEKKYCVGFGGMNCAIKTKIMQECNLVTIKKGSC